MHPREIQSPRAGVFACLMWTWLWAVSASAQPASSVFADEAAGDVSEYDRIVAEAVAKYRANELELARTLFSRAHVLEPSARTSRALGMTHMALESYGLAQHELRAALVDERKPLTEPQRRQVLDLLEWMRENLVVVRLRYAPPHARAEIDRRPVSLGDLLLEPGQHEIQVSAPGFEPQQQSLPAHLATAPFELQIDLVKQSGEPTLARLQLRDDGSSSDAWLWVGVPSVLATVSGAGLLAAGLIAISEAEEPDGADHIERFYERSDRGRLYTALGFGIGGAGLAGLAAAAVLKVNEAPGSRKSRGFSYRIDPTRVVLIQRF
jgi:hypothetical protein